MAENEVQERAKGSKTISLIMLKNTGAIFGHEVTTMRHDDEELSPAAVWQRLCQTASGGGRGGWSG